MSLRWKVAVLIGTLVGTFWGMLVRYALDGTILQSTLVGFVISFVVADFICSGSGHEDYSDHE